MFHVTNFRRSLVKDIPLGNLVVCRLPGGHFAGIVVQAVHEEGHQGILFLPPVPGEKDSSAPFFHHHNDPLLDTGVKPEFVWAGNWETLSDATQQFPPAGHLVVFDGTVCISGRARGRGPYGGGTSYWKVDSGELFPDQNVGQLNRTFVQEWRVGWRDLEKKFCEVAKFPVPAAA